jgi:hypothetical protein
LEEYAAQRRMFELEEEKLTKERLRLADLIEDSEEEEDEQTSSNSSDDDDDEEESTIQVGIQRSSGPIPDYGLELK